MKITRDVITDLLPTYLANEASADTRALLAEFFQQDPEFAHLVQEKQSEEFLRAPIEMPLTADHEQETLKRTRALLRRRTWWCALAVMFTALPLSFFFDSGRFLWIMIRDSPQFAIAAWVAAVFCWIQYFKTRRSLRLTGL